MYKVACLFRDLHAVKKLKLKSDVFVLCRHHSFVWGTIFQRRKKLVDFLFSVPSARFVGGRSPREGLVQVYYNKTWNWVCADQWDKQDADVACRMMDFDGSLSAAFENDKFIETKSPYGLITCDALVTNLLFLCASMMVWDITTGKEKKGWCRMQSKR